MALSVSTSIHMKIAKDDRFNDLLFDQDDGGIDSTSWTEGSGKVFDVAEGATYTIPLDGLGAGQTGGLLYVHSTRQVDLLLEHTTGLGDQEVRLGNAVDKEGWILMQGPFVTAKIRNASGAAATLTVGFVGA